MGTTTLFAHRAVVLVSLGLVLAVASLGSAAAPGALCAAAKQKAAAKRVAAKLKCLSTAAGRGLALDSGCLAKAATSFDAAFAKAAATGACLTTNDGAGVKGAADACVSSLRSLLGVPGTPPRSSCTAAKLAAAGRKTSARIACYDRSLMSGVPVSAACLDKAGRIFTAAFGKAEQKGDCVTTNDAGRAETSVDTCVSAIRAALPVPTTTTTPTRTSTTTTIAGCDAEAADVVGMTAAHNAVRAKVSPAANPPLAPLCYDSSLAATAQSWANGCSWAHNPNRRTLGLGENIAALCPWSKTAALDAVHAWASEASHYNLANNTCGGCAVYDGCSFKPGCSACCLHYTQMVWRSSQQLGCGIKNCFGNSPCGAGFPSWTFVVCDYKAIGNIVGQRPY